MATDPNVPPPEPVPSLPTPPEPGEVQPTPMPMSRSQGGIDGAPVPASRPPAEDENQAAFLGERNLPPPP